MPRVAMPLTENDIRALHRKKGRDIWQAVGGGPKGFTVRQTKAGSTQWYLRYSIGAAQRVLLLGDYPLQSLDDARAAANTAFLAKKAGADPQREKRCQDAARLAEQAAERRRIETVTDAYAALMASKAENRAGSLKLDRETFAAHIRGRLGQMRLNDLTSADVLGLKVAVSKVRVVNGRRRGGPVAALRAVRFVKQLVRHANEFHDYALRDPTRDVLRKQKKVKARRRELRADELRMVWSALDDPANAPCDISGPMALALKVCMLTLQRCGEVVGMSDSEIKGDTWRLPGARVKNHEDHEVPLTPQTLAVIAMARALRGDDHGGLLFPSPRKPKKGAARAAIDRHSISRAMSRLCEALAIEDARTHDLRRTGASFLVNELDVAPLVVSRVLNHATDTAGGAEITMMVYAGRVSAEKKREALKKWADALERMVTPAPATPASNVTMLRARA